MSIFDLCYRMICW